MSNIRVHCCLPKRLIKIGHLQLASPAHFYEPVTMWLTFRLRINGQQAYKRTRSRTDLRLRILCVFLGH